MGYKGRLASTDFRNEAHLYVPKAESRGVFGSGHRWNTTNHRRARGRLRGHEQHEVEPARRASSGRRRALTSAPRPLSTPRGSGTLRLTLWRTDGLAGRFGSCSRPSKPRAWPAETRTRRVNRHEFTTARKCISAAQLLEFPRYGREEYDGRTYRKGYSSRRPPIFARVVPVHAQFATRAFA